MSDKKDNESIPNIPSLKDLGVKLPKLPKLEFPKISVPEIDLSGAVPDFATMQDRITIEHPIPKINEQAFEELGKEIQAEKRRKEAAETEFRNNVIAQLNTIATNTANLATIAELIHKNNEKQDEIIQLFAECLEISKAQTLEEADSKYRRIMDRINQTVQDVETIQAIAGVLNTVYNGVKMFL